MNVVRSVDAKPRRPLVLIIEDNVTQLDLYAFVLEERFEVVDATGGESGYRRCAPAGAARRLREPVRERLGRPITIEDLYREALASEDSPS